MSKFGFVYVYSDAALKCSGVCHKKNKNKIKKKKKQRKERNQRETSGISNNPIHWVGRVTWAAVLNVFDGTIIEDS